VNILRNSAEGAKTNKKYEYYAFLRHRLVIML
jgi:hypothetical protein